MAVKQFSDPKARRSAWRFILVQSLVAVAVTLLWFFAGSFAALSALFGGLVAVVANTYFALQVLAFTGAQAAGKIVRRMFKAAAIKIVIIAALFALAFGYLALAPLPLLVTFMCVQMTYWLAPLWLKQQ